MEEKKIRVKEIPERKKKTLDELVKLINESKSIIIVSIKNLPAKQFQLINKKLKDKALIRVVKKNIINRAIDKIEKGTIKNFKKYLKEDQALIFSELDVFELSSILSKNKSMARAKIGQEVYEDIIIEPGPTELVPGPVISELGSLGIQFAIEDGKINIKQKKIILKKGGKVSEEAASIMSKLDMKPIAVGLEPVVAYDSKEDKIYEDIKINIEERVEELKTATGRALAFAVKIVYVCKETLKFLLRKAASEEKILESKIKKGPLQKLDKDSGLKPTKEGIKTTEEEIKEVKKAIVKEVENENKENIQQENKSEEASNI